MDIDQLLTFQRVAQLQSISKAADDLYLSVSTVTGRIRSLEEELGVNLFHRTGRKFELSEEGGRFLEYVDRFFSILHEGNQKVQAFREGASGELSVAVSPIAASYVMPKFIRHFRGLAPDLQLRLVSCPNFQVIDRVNNGLAEIGITNATPKEHGLNSKTWIRDEWIAAYPAGIGIGRRTLTPADLARLPLLCYGKDSSLWEKVQDWFAKAGVSPNIKMELDHLETLKELMKQFGALSVLPRVAVMEELAEGAFAQAELDPPLRLPYEISFIYLSDAQLSAAANAFLNAAGNYADAVFHRG